MHRDPEPTVGGEALLRREVVGVDLVEVDRQAARAGGGVDQDQGVLGRRTGRADHRRHHGGRGLVVRPGVGVDAVLGDRDRTRAGLAADHRGVGEPRRGGGRRRELRGELAEGEVLALLADQPERGDVPERRRPAVAQHHLVVGRHREQLGQALADPAHDLAHGRLPVGGAHQRGARRGQRVEVAGLDLRGSGAEPSVGGLEVGGDREDAVTVRPILCSRAAGPDRPMKDAAWTPQATRGHRPRLADPRGRAAAGRGGPGGVRRPLRRQDATPLDPRMFEPPRGAFFVAYRDGEPVATGAWRLPGRRRGRSAPGVPPRSSGCTSPRRARHRPGPAHARPARGGGGRCGCRGDDPRDRDGAAGGDGALRELRLRPHRELRSLQVVAPEPLLRQALFLGVP